MCIRRAARACVVAEAGCNWCPCDINIYSFPKKMKAITSSIRDIYWMLVIRPICITILYYNLPLFIDIFHIKRCYLCLFICFCMLDDSWRMNCRSQDSDGKKRCFDAISRRSEKYQKNYGKSYFPRRRRMPEGEAEMGHRGPTPPGTGHP